ncbi:hypothetical protein D3872_01835 [Massilia cavernae]|uniref:Photosynthesis system II assembly factor Ycf48/Hcf136-like domain-containing protein n=2 Tax=Massilia cavernae TaxID=2320864 RepID=A0A418Y7X3_9BURK|nr:hypothetical protein D3872_01835 [Massilia cavernae]
MRVARLVFLGGTLCASWGALAYRGPVDTPAVSSKFAATAPLLAIARAGDRLVAVGLRGHIVYSDDEGKSWTQARVPVSSDLVAVTFPSPKNGWATGHEGVVLHSGDGGATWVKQLDGRQAAALVARYYAGSTSSAADADFARAARQATAVVAEGNTQALLDIRFDNENSGFAVGTFNRIFHTDDGGKTWEPWMHRTDNPRELHFYSISSDSRNTYLTGERGMVWRLDAALKRFVAIPTPYTGTLFGLLADGTDLLAYGMRGSLLRSGDGGKLWEKLSPGTTAGISGGTVLSGGRIVIVTQAGEVRTSGDRGTTFDTRKSAQPMPYYGVASAGQGKLVVVGATGAKVELLP